MRIGLLADIHEEVELLQAALACFHHEGVEQTLVLGDLAETGRGLEPIIRLLEETGAVGVWGNHELGLCHEPRAELSARYPEPVMCYLRTLRPHYDLGRYRITHAMPTLDPTDPTAYYLSPPPPDPQACKECFDHFPGRVLLMGHYHRWLATTPTQLLPWNGDAPLPLSPHNAMLVVIHAIQQGWCAILDTHDEILTPHYIGD